VALKLVAEFCLGIRTPLDPAKLLLLEQFIDDLYNANEKKNLTSVPRDEAESRHLIESLLISEFIPQGSKVLDIGCGPGFPSYPLAVVRSDLLVTALDSNRKMLEFLLAHPLLNLHVENGRAEERSDLRDFDVCTGRAVAPLALQLELSAPTVRVGGAVIPFRTEAESGTIRNAAVEVLGLELEEMQTRSVPGTEILRVFPIFRKFRATPPEYPRAWAKMRSRPLFEP